MAKEPGGCELCIVPGGSSHPILPPSGKGMAICSRALPTEKGNADLPPPRKRSYMGLLLFLHGLLVLVGQYGFGSGRLLCVLLICTENISLLYLYLLTL